MRFVALSLALLLGDALAGSLAGVTLPDTATVGGQELVLNGVGLREKYFIDIYVGGLYLPAKTSDADKVIQEDVPKKITMHFLYDLRADQMMETMRASVNASPGAATIQPQIDKFTGWLEAVDAGDTIELIYEPGRGTIVAIKGVEKGVIPGVDFMRALFEVYVGPNPPTAALKRGLLGL